MAIKEIKCQLRVSQDGEIKMINRKEFEKMIKDNFSGQTIIGEFRLPKKKRSLGQNNFWWGINIPEIIEGLVEAGYDRYTLNPRAVNSMLERMFLTFDMPSSEYAGEYITITKEAKYLSTKEWMEFMDNVHKWSGEFLGITLSIPLEQKELDLL
jgi:hypothetical protein